MPNNLKQKLTLIGSTGLIGTHFLEKISPDDFQYVKQSHAVKFQILRIRIS